MAAGVNTKSGGDKEKKLVILIDMETSEQTFTTEGFSGPTACRDFSKPFEELAGARTSEDKDTDEGKKTSVNQTARG